MEFGQVHHIEYYVNDLKKSNEFWDWFLPQLKYEKISEWEDGVSWERYLGDTYICFVQVKEEFLNHQNSRQANGLNHIAFMGGTMDQLDELEESLKSRNIKIQKRDGKYLCFEDPNEFAVEVYAK